MTLFHGVSRMFDNDRAVLLSCWRKLTDDELRRLHVFLRGFDSLCQPDDSHIANWMILNGYATGHGDTAADMLRELEIQSRNRAPLDRTALKGRPRIEDLGQSIEARKP
jgi:hypothetical protein